MPGVSEFGGSADPKRSTQSKNTSPLIEKLEQPPETPRYATTWEFDLDRKTELLFDPHQAPCMRVP